MKDEFIVGLDIGSIEARIVVGQRVEGSNRVQIIGATDIPSEGVSRGVVKSIDDATSSVSALLEKTERLIGVPVSDIFLSISDPYVRCERSKGVVAVGKANGEITPEEVDRAIEAARALNVPPNYEILHVIPIRYKVDNQEDVRDPLGMSGIRLEVEALIVQGMSSQIKNLTKAVYRTGLNINDLVLAPLALGEAILTSKQKDLGAAAIGLGSSTTTMAVYEEGKLIHASVIPIGSEHITSDIAIGLRCPINLAERIKTEYGNANPENFNAKETIDLSDLAKEEGVEGEIESVSTKYLAEIIQARVEEIFEKVDEELKKIDRSGLLPAGVVLAGGGAKLAGLCDVAKESLRLPAAIGSCRNADLVFDKVNDLKYLTALGLVVWGNAVMGKKEGGMFGNASDAFGNIVGRIRGIFSKFAP
jgi:cell division protein FtsA